MVPAPTAATTGPPGLRSDLSAYRRALPPALLLGATGEWGGRLVTRGSAPALAAALLDALDDAPRLDGRGRAGRRRVQDAFSVQAVSRQLDSALVAVAPRGTP